MTLREKILVLRTQERLSQEDLAAQMGISRQAVAKWENGQAFPDIQNLIILSDIFKVSVDRLIRENDSCTVSLTPGPEYPKKSVCEFLVKAKMNTYVSDTNMSSPSRLGSKDFQYAENDYTYIDTYIGNQQFAGEEAVWTQEKAVWAMNYYGKILSETFQISFLKEALSLVCAERPFRGPELYQQGDYTYSCQVHGDIDLFNGEEQIYCKGEKVYSCLFHGGCII